MDALVMPNTLERPAPKRTSSPAPQAKPRRRVFFAGLQLYMAACVFAGFVPEFWGHMDKARALAPVIHIHAAVMTLWIVFMAVQGSLPSTGRLKLHRTLGWWGVGIAGLVLITGAMITVQGVHDGWDPFKLGSGEAFAAIPFRDLGTFTTFLVIGLLTRKSAPEAHRRMMTLATLSVIPAGLARMGAYVSQDVITVLNHAPIAALIAYDLIAHRRIFTSTWAGSAFLVAATPACIALGKTQGWQDIIRAVT